MGSLSLWHWLIVLAVVVLVFGTRRLKDAGGDLGSALRNFRQTLQEGSVPAATASRRSEEQEG